MKTILNVLWVAVAAMLVTACSEEFKIDYTAPVSINFKGIDAKNTVTVGKGVSSYTTTISVNSSVDLSVFQIFNASATTGEKLMMIDGTEKVFEDGSKTYSTDYTFDNLVDNQCIKVIVMDKVGNSFERNLLVKITPAVIFTESPVMETAEVYYGIYFASWLGGRVYMRDNGAKYAGEIDFSLGEADMAGDGVRKPCMVSPARRGDYGLMNIGGLTDTKFALTDLTPAQFNAIGKVDATPIEQLAEPTSDIVELQDGVYLFQTAAGKRGLVLISGMKTKTATVEMTPGEWVKDTPYRQMNVTAKVVAR